MAELALEHVGKVYRNGYEAIHDFSLEIKEGAFQRRGAYSAQSKVKTTNDRSEKHATLLHVFLIMLQFEKGLLQRNTETL